MARVTTVIPFTGHVGDVAFKDGVAETDAPEMLEHFARHPENYTVEGYDPKPSEPEAPKPGSKDALVAEAEALGLSTDGTKAELSERIAAKVAEAQAHADANKGGDENPAGSDDQDTNPKPE